MGIQPTDDLQHGASIVAGPYHPAFRQLVESEICYDALARLIGAAGRSGPVVVSCAPQSVSAVVGQRRHNIERLQLRYGVRIGTIRQSPEFHRHDLQVESPGYRNRINMVKDIY
jgi:hypothetical protein